jgi:hypothetical protein
MTKGVGKSVNCYEPLNSMAPWLVILCKNSECRKRKRKIEELKFVDKSSNLQLDKGEN